MFRGNIFLINDVLQQQSCKDVVGVAYNMQDSHSRETDEVLWMQS